MKVNKRYIKSVIVIVGLGYSFFMFGQFGAPAGHFIGETNVERNARIKEEKKIKAHNEWVKNEEERLTRGKYTGAIMCMAGLGLICIGGVVQKRI